MSLSAGLVDLIHLVELNDTDWWTRACRHLAMGVLWLAGRPQSPESVSEILAELGVDLDVLRCQQTLQALSTDDVAVSDGSYALTETGRLRVEEQVEESRIVEVKARERFEQSLRRHCSAPIDPTEAWAAFNETLLLPMVGRLGARTYDLLRGEVFRFDPAAYLDPFVERSGEVDRSELLAAVADFLDPSGRAVRDYLLRHMTTSFVLRAAGLDDLVLKDLRVTVEEPAEFVCFLDTNVLFSVLDLHVHPANDAVTRLLEVIENHRDRIAIQFRVLPITLEEAKAALIRAREACRGMVLSPNLASAARQLRFNGLVAGFIEQAQARGVRDPERYFDEIIDNLLNLCRNRGVELYNGNVDDYTTADDVVTDIMDQLDFERSRRRRPKSYEQVEHDMVLWHHTRHLRPRYVDSPLAARYWIATVDSRLSGFDAFKFTGQRAVPVCIDPTALLQLLQFWVPRSEAMDRALVASLQLAFLFQEFDQEAEGAVVKVLRTLSRYEGAAELSESTVARILVNGELRRRLALTDDRDEERELVRDELIEIHRDDQRRIAALEEQVARERATATDEADRLQRAAVGHLAERDRAAEEAEAARTLARSVERRLRAQEARHRSLQTSSARVLALEDALVRTSLVASGLTALLVLVAAMVVARIILDGSRVTVSLAIGLLVSGAWVAAGRRRIQRSAPEVRRRFGWLEPWRGRVLAVASGTATSVLAQLVVTDLFGW